MPRARNYRPSSSPRNTDPLGALTASARLKEAGSARARNEFLLQQDQERAARETARRETMAGAATTEDYGKGLRASGDIEGYGNYLKMAEQERGLEENLKSKQFQAGMLSWWMGKYGEAEAAWAPIFNVEPGTIGKSKEGLITYTNPNTGDVIWANPIELSRMAGLKVGGKQQAGMTLDEKKELEKYKAGLRPKEVAKEGEDKDKSKILSEKNKLTKVLIEQQKNAGIIARDKGYRTAAQLAQEASDIIDKQMGITKPPSNVLTDNPLRLAPPAEDYRGPFPVGGGPRGAAAPSPMRGGPPPVRQPQARAAPPARQPGGGVPPQTSFVRGAPPTRPPVTMPPPAPTTRGQATPGGQPPPRGAPPPRPPTRATATATGGAPSAQGLKVGAVYRHPNGTRARYLGGDPDDGGSWEILR